jgi:PKD repeat protein
MKIKFTQLSFAFLFFLLTNISLANTVIVKGTVKYSDGTPANNYQVFITVDSNNISGCMQTHAVYTNANGNYLDSFTCTHDIKDAMITLLDCNSTHNYITTFNTMTVSRIIERNFTLSCNLQTACKASFNFSTQKLLAKFNSSASNTSINDSIIARSWDFGDSSYANNSVDPSHQYNSSGVYNVCLTIKTKSGCENKYCTSISVKDSIPPSQPITCYTSFVTSISGLTIKFNNNNNGLVAGDSVIGRTWSFGDGTSNTNSIDPVHQYTNPGTYSACLTIKTSKGCESKYCNTITIVPADIKCLAQFTAQRISLKKVQFNSTQSWAPQGDSIINRTWKFGDGTALYGNEINPAKEFPQQGIYNVCLSIKTFRGCESNICKTIVVQDSVPLPPVGVNASIKISSINPNPVTTRLALTVYSQTNNLNAEISIYDIYGTKKWSSQKTLSQGNNVYEIATTLFPKGPYFIKVATSNAKDSKAFYKL